MKDAIFHLANLNLTVAISPDARRWVQEHIVSLETYAWAQAQRRLNGLPLDKGVSVVLDCEDDRTEDAYWGDAKEARRVFDEAAEKLERKPAPVADTYHTKKTEKIVRGEEWPKWEAEVGGDSVVKWESPTKFRHMRKNGKWGTGVIVPGEESGYGEDANGFPPISPAEAAQWLRANGHAAEADRIERERGDGEFEPIGTMPVVGDRVRMGWGEVVTVAKYDAGLLSWYGKAHSGGSPCGFVWDAIKHGDVRILKRERGTELLGARVWAWVGSCTYAEVEINGQCYFEASDNKGEWARDHAPLHRHDPEQRCTELSPDEAKPYLADPALLALVDKGEA